MEKAVAKLSNEDSATGEVRNYEIGSADWNARVKASKFGKIPPYATVKRGFIALQDHESVVMYRNLKIKPL